MAAGIGVDRGKDAGLESVNKAWAVAGDKRTISESLVGKTCFRLKIRSFRKGGRLVTTLVALSPNSRFD